MKRSTFINVVNATISVGSLVAVGVVWSWWAIALLLVCNITSLARDYGKKSLERGGE